MVNDIDKLEKALRARMGRFLSVECKRRHPALYTLLAAIRDEHCPAYLCGGAVRELLLTRRGTPRDIDIIVGYLPKKRLAAMVSHLDRGRTGLGGMKLKVKDWTIDLWRLQETWAFKERKVAGHGFSDYPKTTFLTTDAIAVELFPTRRRKRNVYSKGFFEALDSKVVELNFPDNPDPVGCIVRAIQTARRFGFAIGPRLAGFIASYMKRFDVEELAAVYSHRYSQARVSADALRCCMRHIEAQLEVSNRFPVRVLLGSGNNSDPDNTLSADKTLFTTA